MTNAALSFPDDWPEEWPRTAENLAAVEAALAEFASEANRFPAHWHQANIALWEMLTYSEQRELNAMPVREQWQRLDGIVRLAPRFEANMRKQALASRRGPALVPLMKHVAGKMQRSHYRANTAFDACAYALNEPDKQDAATRVLAIQTRENLKRLGAIGPIYSHKTFAKWFKPGEAQAIVDAAKSSAHGKRK